MSKVALRLLGFVFACSAVLAATDRNRDIVLAPHDGTAAGDVDICRWQEIARASDVTGDLFEWLGWAYVATARRTPDAGFCTLAGKAAEVADTSGARVGSQLLRGHVLRNLHRFREAELVARQLVDKRETPTTGDVQGADEQMLLALAAGTNDARIFLHSGEIVLTRGELDGAEKHFAGAFVAAATLRRPSELCS